MSEPSDEAVAVACEIVHINKRDGIGWDIVREELLITQIGIARALDAFAEKARGGRDEVWSDAITTAIDDARWSGGPEDVADAVALARAEERERTLQRFHYPECTERACKTSDFTDKCDCGARKLVAFDALVEAMDKWGRDFCDPDDTDAEHADEVRLFWRTLAAAMAAK